MTRQQVYIVVGNDGFPRFADPEATRLFVAKSREAAIDTAKDMVKECPFVVFGIYKLEANVFNDGSNVVVVGEQDKSGGLDEEIRKILSR